MGKNEQDKAAPEISLKVPMHEGRLKISHAESMTLLMRTAQILKRRNQFKNLRIGMALHDKRNRGSC